MTLRPALQQAVDTAALFARQTSARAELSALWQVIVGPPRSGKTSQAYEYAQALSENSITRTKPLVTIDGSQRLNDDALDKAFEQAEGAVLVIDEVYKMRSSSSAFIGRLVEAYDSHSTVVVFTGDKDQTRKFLDTMRPEAGNRFGNIPFVETERSFTQKEMEDYREKRFAAGLKEFQDEARERISAEWKHVKKLDVSVQRKTPALKTASFRKGVPA